ncbi:MAG: c-type cytochrome [Elusimicrobiota bacterium]
MTRFVLLCALAAAPARASEPAISFMSGGKEVLRATAAELGARRDARVVTVADPTYGKTKRYRAVPIRDLLAQAYGPEWVENGVGEILFATLDGYRPHAPVPTLAEEGGMLVFADADDPGWEEAAPGKLRPGPFSLVWAGAEQTPQKGYPWPWRLAEVRSAIIEDAYPKAVPRNMAPKSRAPAGWAIFRRSCISCHAMNGQGGTVGPDLNEPRGITSYHEKKDLKAFILKASAFRRTKMPDFPELTARDLDDLVAYFDFLAVQAGTK